MATIHHFDTLPSTNGYLELLDIDNIEEFTIIFAREQTNGKGQRGNYWHSEAGKNLTISILLHPTTIKASQQFILTQSISLAIIDCIASVIPPDNNLYVKWPNDIYVGTKKICGTLIQTTIKHNVIANAICGIGLNVNQKTFPDNIPNPISLHQIVGKDIELDELMQTMITCIEKRYLAIKEEKIEELQADYKSRLMNCDKTARYIYQGQEIRATITGTDTYGRLKLTTEAGTKIQCELKEIKYITT